MKLPEKRSQIRPPRSVKAGSKLTAKNATVFWDWNNISDKKKNNKFSVDGVEQTLPDGYYSFSIFKKIFQEHDAELTLDPATNFASLHAKTKGINLEKAGLF